MLRWSEFQLKEPALSEIGRSMFFQFGIGLGFLATVRKDGGPRVHPVCPILHDGDLYILVLEASPKRRDLERDGRYALHSFPAPENDNEFYCAGTGERVDDAEMWEAVAALTNHDTDPGEVLFRLSLDRVLYTTWENPRQPDMKPVYQKWRA